MEKTKMNRQLGTKWFTFYTKVRPWLGCCVALGLLVDFLNYTNVYFSYWWMFLYFATGIAWPVISIMVFVKSSGDYEDFVRFVNRVLIFETIVIAYQQGVKQYLKNFRIGSAIAITLIILVVDYFLWYQLNIKYFEKRILKEDPEVANYNYNSFYIPPQISNPNEIKKEYGNYNVFNAQKTEPIKNAETKTESAKTINDFIAYEKKSNSEQKQSKSLQFCKYCGAKVDEDSVFCSSCGKKLI